MQAIPWRFLGLAAELEIRKPWNTGITVSGTILHDMQYGAQGMQLRLSLAIVTTS
jgi:hypothetical protein